MKSLSYSQANNIPGTFLERKKFKTNQDPWKRLLTGQGVFQHPHLMKTDLVFALDFYYTKNQGDEAKIARPVICQVIKGLESSCEREIEANFDANAPWRSQPAQGNMNSQRVTVA